MIDSPLVRFDKQKIIFQQNGQNKKARGGGNLRLGCFTLYYPFILISSIQL